MVSFDPTLLRKGRGALSNAVGRFEPEQRVAFDDGWGSAGEAPAPLATTLIVDSTRTIIARNTSPDVGFDRSINPYRGCEHGCVYCFARPTNADPYQPTERKLEITRGILEVLQAADHPVCIVTKSALIQRDIDILAAMAKKRLATVSLSVTTLDRGLARTLEPRAATPERRLETIRALAAAGIPTGVLAAPMIP